jgi:hypothetical protein
MIVRRGVNQMTLISTQMRDADILREVANADIKVLKVEDDGSNYIRLTLELRPKKKTKKK